MDESRVLELFRTAMVDDDAAAMREGLELLLGIADRGGLSSDREYFLRRPDFVMEMPQSHERLRGRDAMRQLQERFPGGGPSVALRRVVGSGRVWVVEAFADYGEDPWHVVVIFELDEDGFIARETRYYTGGLEAPEWRADLVEPVEEGEKSAQSVYEAMGGHEALLRLARAWHARVMADEVVSHAFSHGFHPQHEERLAAYWAEALGGPTAYSDRYGDETSVVRLHSGNGPHEEMDRRAIACFDAAMTDVGLGTSDPVRAVLHDYFAWATTTTMARFHGSAGDVPAGMSIPHWSWDGLVE